MKEYRVYHDGKYMGYCNDRPPEIAFTDNCYCDDDKNCHYIHIYRLSHVQMAVDEKGPYVGMFYRMEQAHEITETMQ